MVYDCKISEQDSLPVLSIRKLTSIDKLPEVIGQVYKAVFEYLSEIGEYPVGAPFAAYYNMDMENLEVEMGFPVARVIEGKGDIKASEIKEGRYAETIHKGPYATLAPAYEALAAWVQERGYVTTGVVYEFYLNDPMEVAEKDLETKIMFELEV